MPFTTQLIPVGSCVSASSRVELVGIYIPCDKWLMWVSKSQVVTTKDKGYVYFDLQKT